jgi:hypothetical protein
MASADAGRFASLSEEDVDNILDSNSNGQVQYTVKRRYRTFHFKYSFDINMPYVMYYVMYIKLVDRLQGRQDDKLTGRQSRQVDKVDRSTRSTR